ncbi:TUTL-like protein [Mya arenaria]|uniref:TUTL-like protein n=1 Tax=Mya arenaria TaxID=6604 RepID=A0ABY7E8S5_MYAAR|nr:TUTL-like protein [Mya arenaria]
MGLYKQSEGLKTASNTNELEFTISSTFPRPRVADFVWEKEGSRLDTWHIVSNDTDINILISEDGLQTKLSFSSIKQKDFGFYRVRVSNKLGQFIGTFRLQAPVRPHTPSNLQHFKKATVDTIYIVWTPAYDGGLSQTFHVEYREAGTSVWGETDVIAGNINHTIVGLNQDTTYEIRVYSTNVIGRSVSSEVITITTLKRPETNSDAGTVVGGAVGASIGAVLVVLVVLVILRRKFAVNCNVVRKIDFPAGQNVPDTDSPGCNAAQTYDEVSMTNNASHYDVLSTPDNLDLYTPLDVSNSKPNVNERKEEPTYINTVQTVL